MSDLQFQRRVASELMKCSPKRVYFEQGALEDIREAITKASVRDLIATGAIQKKPKQGVSRGRARKQARQKSKGRQKGMGSRKGKRTARLPKKRAWADKVRAQRALLKELRDKGHLDPKTYRMLYAKAKGGFFRSRRHIKLYIDEQKLAQQTGGK